MERIREEDFRSAVAAKKRKVGSGSGGGICSIQSCHSCGCPMRCEGCAGDNTNEGIGQRVPSSPPTPPPDPRRYWALWAKRNFNDDHDNDGCVQGKRRPDKPHGRDINSRDERNVGDNAAVDVVAGSTDGRKDDDGDNDDKPSRSEAVAISNHERSSRLDEDAAEPRNNVRLRKWENEMELALHCQRVWDQIELCHQRIKRHEQMIRDCRQKAKDLERELHDWIVMPRLFVPELAATYSARSTDDSEDDEDDDDEDERVAASVYDERILPRRLKDDKDFAWAILNSDKPQPVAFQKMLWMDPTCPLRTDRDILMASIDKGLECKRVTIVWSQDMANDKELVQKCFEKCPRCLSRSRGGNGEDGGLPASHLEDMDNLRAFAFSDHENARACRKWGYRRGDRGTYHSFSKALFQDPDLMADLVLQDLCAKAEGRNEGWAGLAVDDAFPIVPEDDEVPTPQPLLDSTEFVLRVARGLMGVPDSHRHGCPVTYRRLSPRLRANPEVAMAFIRLHPTNILFVPPEEDKSLWLELLLSIGDENDPRSHIPESLKHDPDIVDAQLRCPITMWRTFQGCYSKVPLALRHRFAHRLVAAIESSDSILFEHYVITLLEPDLLRIPEVAHAALSKGWNPDSRERADVIRSSSWTNDPAFLLSLAGSRSTGWGETFWKCCSDELRSNKAFLLEVLKLDNPPPLFVKGDLKNDYDILCATFAHRDPPGRVPTRHDLDFIRTVRGRLQQYLSLKVFISGIQSGESHRPRQDPSPPVTLPRQDRDALEGFKRRMVELLGCPSHEEATVLRKVSLTFIMHGF